MVAGAIYVPRCSVSEYYEEIWMQSMKNKEYFMKRHDIDIICFIMSSSVHQQDLNVSFF
jgi:hypothetical protein